MTDPIGNCILAGVNGAGKSTLYEALNELKGMPRINTDEIVKERVKIRINKGGHGISEEDIERRYVETFKNLKDVLKYCDLAAFYDNTKNFHRFAIFRNGEIARISTILPTCLRRKNLFVLQTCLSALVINYYKYFFITVKLRAIAVRNVLRQPLILPCSTCEAVRNFRYQRSCCRQII